MTKPSVAVERGPGADASVWGPSLWTLLFTMAFKSRAEDAATVRRALEELQYIIPCRACRRSYTSFLLVHPLPCDSASGDALPKWLWQCKDAVNQKLRQTYRAYPDVARRYKAFHTHTSMAAALDIFVIMANNASDAAAPHLLDFVRGVGSAMRPVFGNASHELANLPPVPSHVTASAAREVILELHAAHFCRIGVVPLGMHKEAIPP